MLWRLYKLIKLPSGKQRKAVKRLSAFERLRMSLSQRIILRLKTAYEKYAFREEIRLAGGKDLIIFEFRDTVFENELKQMGFRFELRPALHPRKDLYMGATAKLANKRFYQNFDLSPSITIKQLVINNAIVDKAEGAQKGRTQRHIEERKPIKPVTPVEPLRITVKVEGAEIDNSF